MSEDEFKAHTTRLYEASELLRDEGCLLDAIGRRYYIVYAYAVRAAEKHQVVFRRGASVDETRRLTHQALPNILRALYTGQNSGSVLGSGPRRDPDWAIDGCRGLALC
jgi:hypothetical protein